MAQPPITRITIVGGGVIGISSAITIINRLPCCHVTVISEHFSPNTTGDLSAGLWEPFLLEGSPDEDVDRWASATWDQFAKWHRSSESWGVSMVPGVSLYDSPRPADYWGHIVHGYKELTAEQSQQYGQQFMSGCSFTTYFAEPAKFLPKLEQEIMKKGGVLKQGKVEQLSDVADGADLVVNCTGIGARWVVPDDTLMPQRGQVLRVKAPWINKFIIDNTNDSFSYILPNIDCVVLGGSHESDNWSLEEDGDTSRTILERCCKLVPSLQHAKVLGCNVGLRPSRPGGVRLEAGTLQHGGRTLPVVHNYGHGGCGITLMWGCAQQTATLVSDLLPHTLRSAL